MSYLLILIGLLLIAVTVIAWRSEAFSEYMWRSTTATRTRFQPKLTKERGRVGIRGALTLVAVMGALLVVAGISTLF
jgi:hypothetical protein